MANLEFKNSMLIIGNLSPSETDLRSISDSKTKHHRDNNVLYTFKSEYNETEKYLWLYAEYEDTSVRNEMVFDESTNLEEVNPRAASQIEFKHQLFCIYFVKSDTLYISNFQKKKMLQDYIQSTLGKSVSIKNEYKSIDEFNAKLKTLKEVSFLTKSSLFTNKNGIYNECNDIFGFDNAESVYMKINYGRLSFGEAIASISKRMDKQQHDLQINSLVICGYDDKDIESTFDSGSYIKSISINIDKESNGLYQEEKVKQELFFKLRDETNV